VAILDVVETGHARVSDLRSDLDRVREALDRTDAVLSVTDEALEKAGTAIATGRRWAPTVLIAASAVTALGVVAIVVLVRRRRRRASGPQD
jgi:hypothetical protein